MFSHFTKVTFFTCLILTSLSTQTVDTAAFDPLDQEAVNAVYHRTIQTIESELKAHEQAPHHKEFILNNKGIKASEASKYVQLAPVSKQFAIKEMSEELGKQYALLIAITLIAKDTEDALNAALSKQQQEITPQGKIYITQNVLIQFTNSLKHSYKPGSTLQDFSRKSWYNNNETKVEELVKKELSKLPSEFMVVREKYFSENDIHEIYGEGQSGLISQLKEKNKIYTEKDCAICTESFNKLGNRITLPCGHRAVCAPCLAQHIHQYKKNTCPMCRAQFNTSAYSKEYLKKEMAYVALAQLMAIDRNVYQQFCKLIGIKTN